MSTSDDGGDVCVPGQTTADTVPVKYVAAGTGTNGAKKWFADVDIISDDDEVGAKLRRRRKNAK